MTAAARKPVELLTNAEAVAELRRVAAPTPGCAHCGGPAVRPYCAGCEALGYGAPPPRQAPAGGPIAPAPGSEAGRPLDRAATEAEAQAAVVEALRRAGWSVWRVGQRDARGTQDPGVADLVCLRERLEFVEMKRPVGGVQSDAQRDFERACLAAGVAHRIARGVADVADLLCPPSAGGDARTTDPNDRRAEAG